MNNAIREALLDNLEELLPFPVVVEDVLRTEVNSQFLVLTGVEGLDTVPDTAKYCLNIVPGEAHD